MGGVEVAGTWRTTAPCADVFAVVMDLSTWPRWWPAIRAVTPTAGTPRAPGTARLTFDAPGPLRPFEVEIEVLEIEVPTRLRVHTTEGAVAGNGTITISEDDGGSATRFEVRLQVRSRALRPVESLLAGATRGSGRERLAEAGDDLARLAGGEPLPHDL